MAGSRDFGKIINERRLALGYSLGQLANRMGTTATKVRSWERGDAVPDGATLEQLAEELNMSTGVLRATLPESEPQVDEPDEATSVVAGPVFSSDADTATESADQDDDDGPEPEPDAAADSDAGRIEASADSEDDEPATEEPPEATVLIAATAAGEVGDEATSRDLESDAGSDAAGPDAEIDMDDSFDTDDQALLLDAPTEAVDVVPSGPVMEPAGVIAAPAMVATAPPRVDLNDVGIPESSGFFAPVERVMALVFDPDKNYLAWIRLVLIILVFFVLLRVLAWAVPEFFDALKDILDTIESTPTEPDPATEFIEGLGRFTGA